MDAGDGLASLSAMFEVHFIQTLRANDPEVGYNRWPTFTPRTGTVD
ncbi:hypothetical protein [Acidovorax sp.]